MREEGQPRYVVAGVMHRSSKREVEFMREVDQITDREELDRVCLAFAKESGSDVTIHEDLATRSYVISYRAIWYLPDGMTGEHVVGG